MFFRASTQERATGLGLTGWVRNLPDGSVEAVFEGEEGEVRRAIDLCCEVEFPARVDSKVVRIMDATGEFGEFSIRR